MFIAMASNLEALRTQRLRQPLLLTNEYTYSHQAVTNAEVKLRLLNKNKKQRTFYRSYRRFGRSKPSHSSLRHHHRRPEGAARRSRASSSASQAALTGMHSQRKIDRRIRSAGQCAGKSVPVKFGHLVFVFHKH